MIILRSFMNLEAFLAQNLYCVKRKITLSDGPLGAVVSEPHRKSESMIPVANLIKDIEKSYDPGKKAIYNTKRKVSASV